MIDVAYSIKEQFKPTHGFAAILSSREAISLSTSMLPEDLLLAYGRYAQGSVWLVDTLCLGFRSCESAADALGMTLISVYAVQLVKEGDMARRSIPLTQPGHLHLE